MRLHSAIAKHGFKRCANGTGTDESGATWMNANNFFFVCPTRHQTFNVALPQGVIKRGLHIIWIATQSGGSKFGFAHGVLRNKKPGVRRVSENNQRVERHHFIF
jgi:frataxin-like iron-binding protein CyaY